MGLPEIRLLQAAIAVARDLNFSRAADRLHIGQSTLSKQIYELESQLVFRLFNRNHQIVELKDAGRAGSGANNFDGQSEVLEKD
jgi:DNA-binding transcriptional LysR family regulator